MLLINLFQNSDGTIAWDNLLILFLAVCAGYFLHRFGLKRMENKKYSKSLTEWESKCKRIENEYRNYKASIHGMEKHNEKAVVELNSRLKGLEGDIRALADEKNKFHHQLHEKDQEIRKYAGQVTNLDERIKSLQEIKAKAEANWESKLRVSTEENLKAMSWETRVKAAEDEAQKARAAVNQAERKKLEAELRLKTTAEYAGKIVPMETELTIAKAQLELLTQSNKTMQQELEAKNLIQISMAGEIESLKSNLKKFLDADNNRSTPAEYL